MQFAISQSVHMLWIPIYIKGVDKNLLYLEPDYTFVTILVSWVFIQLIVLQIQQKYPRFIMPRAVRQRFVQNAYKYERNFEDEAALSNNSYLSEAALQSRKKYDTEAQEIDAKVDRTFKRLRRMRDEECTICLKPMGDSPEDQQNRSGLMENLLPEKVDEFMKTPCNHKFHKKCLLDWMRQKHQCPICRNIIPEYEEE